MRFQVEIDMDNAAFEDDPGELARILRRIAVQVDDEGTRLGTPVICPVRDVNGNTVGTWEVFVSGYAFVIGPCASCGRVFTYNPHKVPSFENDGICEPCITLVNERRKANGLPLWPVAPDAYEPLPEGEL